MAPRDQARTRTLERAEGAIGVLVNNAGYGQEGAFEGTPMTEIRRQFETNVFGLIRLTQLVLPGMRQRRRGRILNVSSMGGRATLPGDRCPGRERPRQVQRGCPLSQ